MINYIKYIFDDLQQRSGRWNPLLYTFVHQ